MPTIPDPTLTGGAMHWTALEEDRAQAPERVRDAERELKRTTDLPVSTVILEGQPTDVLVAQEGADKHQLFIRRLSRLHAVPLSGTDEALAPFFSPDGHWVRFFAHGKLKKIAVTGGGAVTLSDAPSTRGGTWGEDDTIVFAPNQIAGTRLLRVTSAGDPAEPLTSLADGEVIHLWPQVLPGGNAVLYTGSSNLGAYNDANLIVQRLPAGERTVVQRGGYHGRYLTNSGPGSLKGDVGHLVYMHNGTLRAAPFDLERLEVTGQAVPALEGVASNTITGGAQYAVSAAGTLAYLPGHTTGPGTLLLWMDEAGDTTPLGVTPANWFNLRFAPDGRRLAMDGRDEQADIWVYEWPRDRFTPLTTDPADDRTPVWTPDGRRIAFASARADKSTLNLYWQRADGAGDAQRLTDSRNPQFPVSWHPSGRFLAFEEMPQPRRTAEALVRGALPDAGIEPHVRPAPRWDTGRAPARRAGARRHEAGPRDVHLQFLRRAATHRAPDRTMTRLAVTR